MHENRWSQNTTWVTPKWIKDWLGEFDLDPATFDGHPWPFGKKNLSSQGLDLDWNGRVFLNPPYESRQIVGFMRKMAEHCNGVSVVAARVETKWFQDYVFGKAQAVFFPKGRIQFCKPNGAKSQSVGFPSCIVFYEQPPASVPIPGTWWRPNPQDQRAGHPAPINPVVGRTLPEQGP